MPVRRALAALCLLAWAPATASAFPGVNGAVAYTARSAGTDRVLVRTGAGVRAVLPDGASADPSWSPLGRRLAVVRATPAGRDIWVVDADGQGARRLTTAPGDETDPAWSPGGNEVAFTAHGHVYAVTADGSGRRQITSGKADERGPAWSPGGRIAYVVHTRRGDDLYVISSSGGRPRRLTRMQGNEHAPAWSPDGRRLVFVHAGALWTVAASGKRPRPRRVGHIAGDAPAWSPDGRRIVYSAGRPGRRRIASVSPSGGRAYRALSTPAGDGRTPDWQPAGFDPVVVAAGDIACDPGSKYFNNGFGIPRHCGHLRTSNLLLDQDLWRVLPLGDTQYQDGAYEKFLRSYDPTWGRTKYLQSPVIGNHEYATGATGYFDYFNGVGAQTGPAGDRALGYYSFDVGTWHVVALNSECRHVEGGCGAGSPQQQWLAADLAAHPARCTLAMWHTPRFSSYRGGNAATKELWRTLEDAGADVVLSGHHHFYERLAPQTATGAADDAHGIRQFTVGTGGGSIADAEGRLATSQRLIETTFGILRLGLHPGGYDWRFESASADPATDAGNDACR